MEKNNPNNMSNQDLENDMQQLSSENNLKGNQEKVNKSSATEGTLIEPEQDLHQKQAVDYFGNIKSDSNNTQDGGEDGSLPDPEELSLEEEEESFNDPDKISG
ncbi:MAG: hypothetical protein H0X70_05665 [Segetibacter sp.]|jgi:hypothetical protein|nr:hypothetical protein [Segetibacter sp.]